MAEMMASLAPASYSWAESTINSVVCYCVMHGRAKDEALAITRASAAATAGKHRPVTNGDDAYLRH